MRDWQRREFFRNGLALGAGALLPGTSRAGIPGLDYTREPVKLTLSERGNQEVMPVSGKDLEELPGGCRVIVSGPMERRSGRA